MNKREFLKSAVLAGAGVAILKTSVGKTVKENNKPQSLKHWVWENPNQKETDEMMLEKYKGFYSAGISGCLL